MKKSLVLLSILLAGCAVNYNTASIEYVVEKAESGDADAVHSACYRYMYGRGNIRDYDLAFKWCSAAAKTNNASSITLLGELYYLGNGVEKNYKNSYQLYQIAANIGHPHAQLMMYFQLVDGQGVEENHEEALRYLKMAASQDYSKAIEELQRYNE